jgi:hypothetical protein
VEEGVAFRREQFIELAGGEIEVAIVRESADVK